MRDLESNLLQIYRKALKSYYAYYLVNYPSLIDKFDIENERNGQSLLEYELSTPAERFMQSIVEHKLPLLDKKLKKTGEELATLVVNADDDDVHRIQEILDSDNARYAEPISAHPPRIVDQIEENAVIIENIDKRSDAYHAVKRAATDVTSKATITPPSDSAAAVKDIKRKLEKMIKLLDDVQKATDKRGVDEALAVAKQNFLELQEDMMEAIALLPEPSKKERDDEPFKSPGETSPPPTPLPASEPIVITPSPKRPSSSSSSKRDKKHKKAMQILLDFLAKAEERFNKFGPIGADIDVVKKQIDQLRQFKDDVDPPYMVQVVESLNRQAIGDVTSPEQALAIREAVNQVNDRRENLLRGMVERQKQLEHALLHLGQFQHALNELLVWISKTESTLDQLKPIPGDPQLLEVELAKLNVLANDIQAHQSSVDTLNDAAGGQLIEIEDGTREASTTQEQLQTLNRQWRELQQKAKDRQHELEEALRDAQGSRSNSAASKRSRSGSRSPSPASKRSGCRSRSRSGGRSKSGSRHSRSDSRRSRSGSAASKRSRSWTRSRSCSRSGSTPHQPAAVTSRRLRSRTKEMHGSDSPSHHQPAAHSTRLRPRKKETSPVIPARQSKPPKPSGEASGQFFCSCSRTFSSWNYWRKHKNYYAADKPTCKGCGQVYSASRYIRKFHVCRNEPQRSRRALKSPVQHNVKKVKWTGPDGTLVVYKWTTDSQWCRL